VGKLRPFRFGVQEHRAGSAAEWKEKARRIESMGYSAFYLPDHFNEQLSPFAGLMAAADATTKLRIGFLVLDNDYRHPVVVAKEAATLDLLSDGRLDLGLGAGWLKTDYQQAGIPYDSPGTPASSGSRMLSRSSRASSPEAPSHSLASTTPSKTSRVIHRQSRSRILPSCWGVGGAAC
jgi:alkanesulfonate monooxygenase SsuD/methylene tetrahydromethanopterin reductase-like flavin-dependent oxidoreductase (luciferase family)